MDRITKQNYKFNMLNIMQGMTKYTEIDEIMNCLADYENIGLTPEEVTKLNDFEHSQCAKLLAKNGELERENATLKTALKIIYKDYENDSNRKIDSIKSYIEVAKDCVEFEKNDERRQKIMPNMKPILFNTEMVRAILDGRKTTTRRVINPQPICHGANITFKPHNNDFSLSAEKGWLCCRTCGHDPEYSREGVDVAHHWKPPYFKGDILYVRETFNSDWCDHTIYKADGGSAKDAGYAKEPRWHPSIHMPKEAARIFLRVTGVRAERLQDITEEQAKKEGFKSNGISIVGARCEFVELWNSTIKKQDLDKYGWNANPYVWVIEFERCEKP